MSILAYYNASDECRAALIHACALGRAFGTEIHILVVADIESSIACAAGPFSALAKMDPYESAQARLEEAFSLARAEGTAVRGTIEFGEVISCIDKKTDELGASTVVVGHRKRSWFSRAWLSGNVAARLLDLGVQRVVIVVTPCTRRHLGAMKRSPRTFFRSPHTHLHQLTRRATVFIFHRADWRLPRIPQ
jgi:nucleotide-binding universal stress UspA family protein